MARLLLHRSKSTKELRTKYELPDEGPPRSSAPSPPHTPNKLIRRRAGTIIEPKQLPPSKSIADLRVTVRQGMLVASPLLPERNSGGGSLRTSNKQAFPPTHGPYMESFPARTSSRASLSSSPNTAGIGVAIGSPTKERHMYIGVTGNMPETTEHLASTSIPSFYLPPEPFDIKGDIDWSGGQGGDRYRYQKETRGGWRKLLGRTLFNSKKTPGPAPNAPVVEAPLKPRHIPIVTVATAGATPALNKLKRGESQEREIVEQKAKSRSSPQLLNVEIPTVEMERYSIMFRGLLRDESPTKTHHAQKASLYSRRRSRDILSGSTSKERLKLQLEPLKRHATTGGRITPTPNIPNSTTPFSVTKSNEAPKNNIRLGRSNTTAALTRDPRPGPGFVLAGTTPDTDTIPSVVLQERKKLASIHPNLITPDMGSDSMGSSRLGGSIDLSVNGSFDEGDDYWFSRSALPTTTNKTKYSAACEESLVIKDSTPQASPMQTPSLKQSPPRTEEELMIAAQQSIQRQISLSQRQLLLPVVREGAKPAGLQTPPEPPVSPNRLSFEPWIN